METWCICEGMADLHCETKCNTSMHSCDICDRNVCNNHFYRYWDWKTYTKCIIFIATSDIAVKTVNKNVRIIVTKNSVYRTLIRLNRDPMTKGIR